MKLKNWREQRNLTLAEMGAEVGVSGVTIGRYEDGRLPKPDVLQRIIQVTDGLVTANDWFDLPETAKAGVE